MKAAESESEVLTDVELVQEKRRRRTRKRILIDDSDEDADLTLATQRKKGLVLPRPPVAEAVNQPQNIFHKSPSCYFNTEENNLLSQSDSLRDNSEDYSPG